jgi:hypothetical protein
MVALSLQCLVYGVNRGSCAWGKLLFSAMPLDHANVIDHRGCPLSAVPDMA